MSTLLKAVFLQEPYCSQQNVSKDRDFPLPLET